MNPMARISSVIAQRIATRLFAAHRKGEITLGGRDEMMCGMCRMNPRISPPQRVRLAKLWRQYGPQTTLPEARDHWDTELAEALSA